MAKYEKNDRIYINIYDTYNMHKNNEQAITNTTITNNIMINGRFLMPSITTTTSIEQVTYYMYYSFGQRAEVVVQLGESVRRLANSAGTVVAPLVLSKDSRWTVGEGGRIKYNALLPLNPQPLSGTNSKESRFQVALLG